MDRSIRNEKTDVMESVELFRHRSCLLLTSNMGIGTEILFSASKITFDRRVNIVRNHSEKMDKIQGDGNRNMDVFSWKYGHICQAFSYPFSP